MRVLLIDPPWFSLQGVGNAPLPLGLGYLASYLEKAGHKCIIFSGEVNMVSGFKFQKIMDSEAISLEKNASWIKVIKKLEFLLKKFKPEVIGISMPTAKYKVSKEIIKFLKKKTNAQIVVGGPHASIVPESVLEIDGVDLVVRGEGEETFLEIVNKKPISKIKGISYKKNKKIVNNPNREYIKDLDKLPFPNWDLVYEKNSIKAKNLFGTIIASRGCPYQCIFCASKKIWGLNVRFRSPENVVEEIKEKISKYGVDLFDFNDDSFTIRKENILKFCNLILQNKIKIGWKCDTRVNLLDYELLKKMKQAGCVHIKLGIECGNDKMLKYIKKGITLEQVEKVFKIAHKLGIGTTAYFMIGFPEETREDIEDTINLMKKIKPSHPCWSIATPYPGTELYETCKNQFSKDEDWSTFYHHSKNMGFSKHVTRGELGKIIKRIEKITFIMKLKYYLSHPRRLLKELKLI